MKKLTGILIAAALILAPISASALEMMTDSSMKDVTGQAGVSIAIDDVSLEQWVGATTYTDLDGTTGDTADSTGITISEQHIIQDFQAITSSEGDDLESTGVDLQESGMGGVARMAVTTADGSIVTGEDGGFQSKPLSIDVGTCPVLTEGMTHNLGEDTTIAGVVIGLPTLEINTSSSTKDIQITGNDAAHNNNGTFIRIETGESTMHVLGGTLEIAPH